MLSFCITFLTIRLPQPNAQPPMPVTIKDIAREAGVSHSTVSRALNDHPAISNDTKRRIHALAKKLGYVPSAVAQSLSAQTTQTLGLVVTALSDPFYATVVEGVEMAAQAEGYSVFLALSHNDPQRELAVVEVLQRRRVDAAIVVASQVGPSYQHHLDQLNIPIVFLNNQIEHPQLASVAADDVQGAKLAVEHLLELGHTHIAYINAPNRPLSTQRRLTGYRQALMEAGHSFDPTLVIGLPITDDLERGQQSLAILQQSKATAAFCYNDVSAIGLLMACRDAGVAVPETLSVIGFDNVTPAVFTTPTLTTIHQPSRELGIRATEMALTLLGGQSVEATLLSCKLVVRESTGPKTDRRSNGYFVR